ncbi:MAG TPA: flagellar export protein FliJ [Burkholderiaceae bacterium]|nr:flagellar export protein FliJ [Burkholderiaceae bacterium]
MNPATLHTLIDLAKSKSDAAQVRYAALLRALEQARSHLTTLRQYAREYDDRARCRPGDQRDPSAERNQTAFLQRLHEAVAAQVRELEAREKAAAGAASDLAHCLRRQKSLETLALRHIERERRTEARRDQKNTDEFAQRSGDRAAAVGLNQGAATAGSES